PQGEPLQMRHLEPLVDVLAQDIAPGILIDRVCPTVLDGFDDVAYDGDGRRIGHLTKVNADGPSVDGIGGATSAGFAPIFKCFAQCHSGLTALVKHASMSADGNAAPSASTNSHSNSCANREPSVLR